MPRIVKVAVVGSGLAGLTAAYLLTSCPPPAEDDVEFEVHVFEKAPVFGMDSASISLDAAEEEAGGKAGWRVDVPMRSFQGGYYPQLIALYKHLGVKFRQADFSYSFSLLSPPPCTGEKAPVLSTTLIYNGASGRSGLSMPSALAASAHGVWAPLAHAWCMGAFVLAVLQIALCYARMLLYAAPVLRPRRSGALTFAHWVEETVPRGILARWLGADEVWRMYTRTVLLPLFSAVCTAPMEDVMRHPVEEILDYVWLTLGTHHYVVVNGVRDVVARLTTGVRHAHLATPIASIQADPDDPQLAIIHCETGTSYPGFRHIIFAAQATRAAPLLASYAASLTGPQRVTVQAQAECLRAFTYCSTVVVNHRDATLLPDDPRDRRDLNLVCVDQADATGAVMTTQVLPRPAGHPAVYQTTNPIVAPRASSVVSTAALERAVLTMESKEALGGLYCEDGRRWWQTAGQGRGRLGALQGGGEGGPGLWVCGSYAYVGIPLLEGCVVSARNVVQQGIWAQEGVSKCEAPW